MQRSFIVVDAAGFVIIFQRHSSLLSLWIWTRNGGKKASGIRVQRICKNLIRGSSLQHTSQMKYADPVRNIFDHGKVMRNKKVCRPGLFLNILHQVDYLCLNGNVQCRNTFIRNDQVRVHDQRTGNADTLTLSAGKLIRITVIMLFCQTNLSQDRIDMCLPLFLGRIAVMDIQSLANNIANLLSRVQRSHRVLEDHLHLCTKLFSCFASQLSGNINSVKGDLACCRIIQTNDPAADRSLSGTRLSNKTISLTRIDLKTDIVHCLNCKL